MLAHPLDRRGQVAPPRCRPGSPRRASRPRSRQRALARRTPAPRSRGGPGRAAAEVVERDAVDGGRGEVVLDPGRDRRCWCCRRRWARRRAAEPAAADEVVDPSPSATYSWNCASVGLGSLPLKPPIAITGSCGGQLVAGGRVGADRGRDPGVGGRRPARSSAVIAAVDWLPCEQAAGRAAAPVRPPAGCRPAGLLRGRVAAGAAAGHRRPPPGPPPGWARRSGSSRCAGSPRSPRRTPPGPASAATSAAAPTARAIRARQEPTPASSSAETSPTTSDDPAQPRHEVAACGRAGRSRAPWSARPCRPRSPAATQGVAVLPQQPGADADERARSPGPGPRCSRRGRCRP